MRVFHAALLLALGGIAFALWADEASATTGCQGASPLPTVANTCHGFSHVSTQTGGVLGGTRCFMLRTTNNGQPCSGTGLTPTNEAWQLDGGACKTLYYFDTVTAGTVPAAPNKVSVSVKADDTATNVIVYQSLAAEPGNGATFSFCATDTGLAGGSPRAGTYYAALTLVKDNGNGLPGNANYNINTQGQATVGAILNYDRGALRAGLVFSGIGVNAYPSGSTFAYGPGGDETMTVTATFTTPNIDNANRETMQTGIVDEATLAIGSGGATVDVDTGSLAQNFVVDGTFPFSNNPYVAAVSPIGSAALTGNLWAHAASTGHCATCVKFSDGLVYNSNDIAIDPRIVFDSDGAGTFATADDIAIVKLGTSGGPDVDVFNRGETVYSEFYLFNARGQQLTRTMTIGREDATPTTCASAPLSPSSGKYTFTGTITLATCVDTSTVAGAPRYYRATATDQSHRSAEVHGVSDLLFIDAHLEADSGLTVDDYPTEDAGEVHTFQISSSGGMDTSDTIYLWCGVQGVRKDVDIDTSGTAVTTWRLVDPLGATRASTTGDTGANGFTTTSLSLLATTPLGSWDADCAATWNANTGSDTEPFTIDVSGGGGGTEYVGTDPLKVYPAWHEGYLNQSNLFAISAAFLDGTPREDAEDELLVDVDCNGAAVVTGASPTERGAGAYYYEFAGHDEPGHCLIVVRNTVPATMGAPVANAFTVQNATGNLTADMAAHFQSLDDHRESSIEVLMTSDFAGIGFDGFLLLMFWVAAALFFVFKDWAFSLAFTIPGILQTLFPDQIPGEFALYLLLAFLGVVMQYFVGDRQKFSLHGKKKETGA